MLIGSVERWTAAQRAKLDADDVCAFEFEVQDFKLSTNGHDWLSPDFVCYGRRFGLLIKFYEEPATVPAKRYLGMYVQLRDHREDERPPVQVKYAVGIANVLDESISACFSAQNALNTVGTGAPGVPTVFR